MVAVLLLAKLTANTDSYKVAAYGRIIFAARVPLGNKLNVVEASGCENPL